MMNAGDKKAKPDEGEITKETSFSGNAGEL